MSYFVVAICNFEFLQVAVHVPHAQDSVGTGLGTGFAFLKFQYQKTYKCTGKFLLFGIYFICICGSSPKYFSDTYKFYLFGTNIQILQRDQQELLQL